MKKDIEKKLNREIDEYLNGVEKYILDKISNKLQGNIPMITKNITQSISADRFDEMISKLIREQFFRGFEDGLSEVGDNYFNIFKPNENVIQLLNSFVFDNVKGLTNSLKDRLRTELQLGYINGEGIRDISKRVRDSINISKNKAETIARTETNRAFSKGKEQFYKSSGLKDRGYKVKKWILITEDNRTSVISKALSEKYGSESKAIDIDKNFKLNIKIGKKIYRINQSTGPFHPNERDRIIYFVDFS